MLYNYDAYIYNLWTDYNTCNYYGFFMNSLGEIYGKLSGIPQSKSNYFL